MNQHKTWRFLKGFCPYYYGSFSNRVFSLCIWLDFSNLPIQYCHQPGLKSQFVTFQHITSPLITMENQAADGQHKCLSEDEPMSNSEKLSLSRKPPQCDDKDSKTQFLPLIQPLSKSVPNLCESMNTNSQTSSNKVDPHDNGTEPPKLLVSLRGQGENEGNKAKGQLSSSLLKCVESFVKDNIKLVTDQINRNDHQEVRLESEDYADKKSEDFQSSDTEMLFCNMDLSVFEESNDASVVGQSQTPPRKKKKTSRKKAKSSGKKRESVDMLSDGDIASEERIAKRKYPNYFVAIQVNDSQIVSNTIRIQAGIQEASGQDLSPLKITPETLHITLMIMHLSNKEEVDRASQCLETSVSAIKETQGDHPVSLEFENLSKFGGGRVIFARVKDPGGDILQLMSDEVKKKMKERDVESNDPENKPFQPHLTLMKCRQKSKSKSKSELTKSPKKIENEWFDTCSHEYLGSQTVHSLQLCSMQNKREDGYYFVAKEVPFLSLSVP